MTPARTTRALRILAWLTLPVLLIAGAERLVRRTVDRVPLWYPAAEVVSAKHRIDVVFIGSSRVAAAVYAPAFEQEAKAALGRKVRALNLGRGATHAPHHYFGLRNLLTSHPESFRGVDVLVEASSGWEVAVPWKDRWARGRQPALLLEVMEPVDLPRFWKSKADVEEKVHLSVREVAPPLSVIKRRERFREFLRLKVAPWATGAFYGKQHPLRITAHKLGKDLTGWGAGGTRRLKPARKKRGRAGKEASRGPNRLPPWKGSVQEDILRLVESHGGRLVYFRMPVSSRHQPNEETFQRFEQWTQKAGVRTLAPAFEYEDRDFPDRSHLDGKRAPEFAQALARVWAENATPRTP